MENIDGVHEALTTLGKQYSQEVVTLSQDHEPLQRHRNILQYLTNTLLHQKKTTKLVLSKTEAVRLKSVYTITCLMMLKEYMHRNTAIKTIHPTQQYHLRMESSSLELSE